MLPDFSDADSDDTFHHVLGYRVTELRSGYARMEMIVQQRHRNNGDYVHGGVLMTLLDVAALRAGAFDYPQPRQILTLSLSTNFISAALTDTIIAEGFLQRAGKSIYFADSKISDGRSGEVFATAQGAFRYRQGRPAGTR